MKYNKLVRDKIPEIIIKNGNQPITHIADDWEYWQKLKEKLQEEVDEFLQTESEEELADVLEVIYAIYIFKKISRRDLEILRKRKARHRGGFKNRVILDETR